MVSSFREQLLKTGIVTKQQAHKARKSNKKKKQQQAKNAGEIDETKRKLQQAAKEKAELDRELNKKKDQQARNKAISIEINQLITSNRIERTAECEIVYNFEHQNKIKRIYVNSEMKQQIIRGTFGIARIEGRYELIPRIVAEKIQQRNPKRVIIFDPEEQTTDDNDPYADYKVPDDLTW